MKNHGSHTGFTAALRNELKKLDSIDLFYPGQYRDLCRSMNTDYTVLYQAFVRFERRGEIILVTTEPSDKNGKDRNIYMVGVLGKNKKPNTSVKKPRRKVEKTIDHPPARPLISSAGVWGVMLGGV